ncbi:MAG: CRISPR system precrRNA processing endoribonuclease RAMP protein Cas6, partial [Nitrososphaeria archaeon]
KNLEFHTLFRALYRRVAAIMYFYCDKEPNFDYKLLTTKSKNVKIKLDNLCWYDWERYSTRQKTKMKLGGLIGKITYQSEETFNLFLPFLTIGQYTHIGKNCTFGLGRYEIENVVI